MAKLEMPDEVYQKLETVAKGQGLTPVEWIEAKISNDHTPVNADVGQRFKSVADAIAPHTVDNRTHTPDPKYRSAFGDLVDENMEKQGFKRPEWPR